VLLGLKTRDIITNQHRSCQDFQKLFLMDRTVSTSIRLHHSEPMIEDHPVPPELCPGVRRKPLELCLEANVIISKRGNQSQGFSNYYSTIFRLGGLS